MNTKRRNWRPPKCAKFISRSVVSLEYFGANRRTFEPHEITSVFEITLSNKCRRVVKIPKSVYSVDVRCTMGHGLLWYGDSFGGNPMVLEEGDLIDLDRGPGGRKFWVQKGSECPCCFEVTYEEQA